MEEVVNDGLATAAQERRQEGANTIRNAFNFEERRGEERQGMRY